MSGLGGPLSISGKGKGGGAAVKTTGSAGAAWVDAHPRENDAAITKRPPRARRTVCATTGCILTANFRLRYAFDIERPSAWLKPFGTCPRPKTVPVCPVVMTLAEQLAALEPAFLRELHRYGFDPGRLEHWARTMGGGDERNRVKGKVSPPEPGDISPLPDADSAEGKKLAARGMEALSRGELGFVVLAGGMATRMGGLVKALVEAAEGQSFLDLRLAEQAHWATICGVTPPLWLMTSHATEAPIRSALGPRLENESIATFPQFVSLRLTEEGSLFFDGRGEPSVYATGHGDLPDALAKSALLSSFLQEHGDKTLWIANLDNLGASIDPLVLGFHLESGAELTVEVVEKVGSDRGGIPVRYEGRPIVLEELRLPKSFDPSSVRVFNTNTFLVNARALARLAMDFTFLEVAKTVEGRVAIQHERLIGEMTTAFRTSFLKVPRDGLRSRFLPVKDAAELRARRDHIREVAIARGMLSPC